MEFKKINVRAIVLIFIAVFLLLIIFIANHGPKSSAEADDQAPMAVAPAVVQPQAMAEPIVPLMGKLVKPPEIDLEDEVIQNQMKEQMNKDRGQQRQIKMLRMQLEQINLQLENEKALTEINKLKKENTGYVKYFTTDGDNGFPNIRIIYIGGTDIEKEAILSVNGTSYSVKEKDSPIRNLKILNITDKGVKVHLSGPQETTELINYTQD